MIKKVKIIIVIFTIILLVFPIVNVRAFEIPDPPPAPTPPPIDALVIPPAPDATETPPDEESSETDVTTEDLNNESNTQDITPPDNQDKQTNLNQLGPSADSNTGDTTIDTGNGFTAGTLTTTANSNTALQQPQPNENQTNVENINNGSDSTNTASLNNDSSASIIQDNNAEIENSMELNTNTGESSASQNVGNSTIATGDANTSGTAITMANTNMAGLAVSEFNIIEDTQGDIILDFASGCISGCGIFGSASAANIGNGSDSINDAEINQVINNESFQSNEATLENNITLTASTGYNRADQNTGGDTSIKTGDANVSANIVNFLNNNIAGNVILGVVNIFGDLIGDIILPQDQLNMPSVNASNTNNGSGSTNSVLIDSAVSNTTFQTNDALIQNNLDFQANTGGNQTSKNTGGNSIIETGEASIESQTINIANSNINGGNWWLVLVNEAGEWVGRILGSDDQSNIAGSSGTQFVVNPNGDVTVTNEGNGSDSNNNASVAQTNNTNTVQNNIAQIINNINLFANTGGNSASKNTGGDSAINTGDASVIANLVNFVNNNIIGGGRLTVTIVNVFGNWVGDFITPDSQKETTSEPVVDGNTTSSTASNSPIQSQNQSQNLTSQDIITQSSNEPQSAPTITAPAGLSSTSHTNDNNQAYIAGVKFEDSGGNTPFTQPVTKNTQDGNKVIELNLAWLLLLLPFGGAAAVIRLRKVLTV